MEGLQWEGSLAYKGDRFVIDPHSMLQVLYRLVRQHSDWVLQTNLCSVLLEQLAMLQFYGGSTLNVDEIIVPEHVYRGLERLLQVDPSLRPMLLPPTQEPSAGIPMRPDRMLAADPYVSGGQRALPYNDKRQ
eukprot:GHVR01108893.1.p1 GENE.GHVR01108893.1~~GHVR01108893.1.p1  ORF type:complete len:132 (-),score=15.97 GHVR01108893.1:328-723(-)